MLFLILTWLSAFIMMVTLIASVYLWANGRRIFKVNLYTISLFLLSLILLIIFS